MMRTILSIILALALGGARADDRHFELAKNLDIFAGLMKSLELMYVDTLDAEELITTGINSMLRTLDPYTEYYPESRQNDLRMLLTGKYAGIGSLVRYHQRLGRVVIDEPYEGMPSAKVGLRKGDIIISIDDSLMTDKTVSYVSERLRGEAGSTFRLKVVRPRWEGDHSGSPLQGGVQGDTLVFSIKRESIKLPEIAYRGIIGDSIGYICLSQFTEGSARNMRSAFIDLKKRGARALVLDLRGNGGGSLQEAIDILSLWLPQGEKLVETRGKMPQVHREYKTRLEPIDTVMPIVVVVNGETASASEITAGSLQDLDRGLVLGTRTFGKGLVQVPIDLPYNTTLKLTTSKYYIPSGRCIQAISYGHSGGGSKERIADSLSHAFYTRKGREVRDVGGIMPDVEVKADTLSNLAYYLDRMDSLDIMFDYVSEYIGTHEHIAPPREFRLSEDDWQELKRRVVESGFDYDPVSRRLLDELAEAARLEGYYDGAREEIERLGALLKHDIGKDMEMARGQLSRIVEQDIVAAYYFQSGAVENALRDDPQIRAAVEQIGKSGE